MLQLFSGGLVPLDIAMPCVLHAIGCEKDTIDAAVARVRVEQTAQTGYARTVASNHTSVTPSPPTDTA